MVPPVETGAAKKAFDWIKNGANYLFRLAKQIATLEERVMALESALKTMPPEACPFCGERAMRLTEQSGLLGNQGTQWTEEDWSCEKCGKTYVQRKPLKTR
ncbi:MAG: hypothetical protein ACRECV_07780 [Xanthobacteraceae bacterium]